MREAGWPADEIEPALAAWADIEFPIPVPRRRPYLSARETFLYLVMFVTLYVTAFNVGTILFESIERWVPDPARRGFTGDRFSPERVRGAVAAVVIAFPIFFLLARAIGRSLRREPEKRASRIRKWLTYLTLFVAALVIIGDLTFLVSRLLSGELPPRFLLKTLVVFAIAAAVFGHYLSALRRDEDLATGAAERAWWGTPIAGTGVLAALAVGLILAGSPGAERRRQLDVQRIDDLRSVSLAIEEYYRESRALPDSLGALTMMPNSPLRSVVDPASGEQYEYRTLDSLRYELCAAFDREGAGDPKLDPNPASRFWEHPAGRTCFTFRIPRALREARIPPRP